MKQKPQPPAVKVKIDDGSGFLLVLLVVGLGAACLWAFLAGDPDPAVADAPVQVAQQSGEPEANAAVEVARHGDATTEAAAAESATAAAVPLVPVPIQDITADVDVDAPASGESAPQADEDPFGPEPVLILVGIQSTSTVERERDAALLAQAAAGGHWGAYRAFLRRSLDATLQPHLERTSRDGFDPLLGEAVFARALLRWRTLQSIPESIIATADRDGGPLVAWMLDREQAMEEWLLTVRPEDDLPRVFDLLFNAWYGDLEIGEKYFNLALACAVVFDRDMRVQHPPASAGYGASMTIDPHERFLWYVDQNERNRLAAPIDRMTAADLVWVVCAPVTTEELDWAVSNLRVRWSRWGETYGMIEYLMERAVNGLNPYAEYTFAEIRRHGGICGDQSYFCANTARANGIPAIILTGETDLGGHAWVALKHKPDEWSTLIGRIGGVANGEGHNPQTRGTTSEQEIWNWNERVHQNPRSRSALWRTLWLADLFVDAQVDDALVEGVLRRAHAIGRAHPETWRRLHNVMAKRTRTAENPGTSEIVDMWMRFVAEMRAEFRDNPRMGVLASNAEDEFIFPHLEENEARRILARERRRLERSAGEQKDLVVASVKREAELIMSSGDDDALTRIARLYSSALRNHGASITGFKMMAEDYFNYAKDYPDHAVKAVRDIELAFNRVIESGSRDWFRANTETSIYKMICDYYRQVGEESRAVALERRYERLLRRAERGALR